MGKRKKKAAPEGQERKSKFKAKEIWVDGHRFDSIKESKRYEELKELLEGGQISDLRLQVPYELIPIQREPDQVGPKGGLKKGKLIERPCVYIADFVYKDLNGNEIVEDVKGFYTEAYIIKRKLMLYLHGIRIKEVTMLKRKRKKQ